MLATWRGPNSTDHSTDTIDMKCETTRRAQEWKEEATAAVRRKVQNNTNHHYIPRRIITVSARSIILCLELEARPLHVRRMLAF